ncbi:Amidohydrolase 3 [Candidatus Koribacter versatilis Ellin345]|uniref:Amidohydrolase 3 n=1 Tax=Koribacter versatilis (strain Ellin345) TaxID=204669 RepID=Q1IHB1_KORVE|nr:amidohydrolase [Candidatus Koribacter versatilis]ABF43739.1 Amidohydrolase 3 [Candidatus Koribacter versatilis Ellin345]
MVRSLVTILATVLSITILFAQQQPADRIYRHGVVFTADGQQTAAEAVAVREGRIVYVGGNAGVEPFVGKNTKVTDLHGGFLMPGLVDGHMHPLEAGLKLQKCSLNYEPITVEEMQKRIQACLDKTKNEEPDTWLEVVSWFQEGMVPAGVKTSRATLDALKTKRPIFVLSSFGHTALANSRALALAKITKETADPLGGKIWHDANGNPTGLLEDAAQEFCSKLLPKPTAQDDLAAAKLALKAMNAQGVTTFLDADTPEGSMVAFTELQKSGKLTARGHFAPQIAPEEAGDPAKAVAKIVAYAKNYDQGAPKVSPGITVRNAKLYLDGVIAAPALTGNMLEPYRVNAGTEQAPNWVPGKSRGPDVYFQAKPLAEILTGLARAGIDPHMHVDGDGAVNAALNGIEAMRTAVGSADIRPGLAHCEIVGPANFTRFKALGAIPVLSFQWEKPAGDTVGLTNYFGPERMKILEPAGLLANAGARVVYGSDWPVDLLDEWFALKVGVTRMNAPSAGFQGKLGEDPGLSPEQVLRAITIDAAYELHTEQLTGSLEVGKVADLIVLDRNPLKIAPEDIANVKVLETVVGGKTVYEATR